MGFLLYLLVIFTIFVATFKDKYEDKSKVEAVIFGNCAIVAVILVLGIMSTLNAS
jgi:hypothetical protein